MAKVLKWLVVGALGLIVLLALITFTLQRWIKTDDFRQRLERQATAALGVPVTLDHVAVDVYPLPAVALSGVILQSKPVLTVQRIEMRPNWAPMLRGRLEVDTLLVRRAVLPQQAIDGLLVLMQKNSKSSGGSEPVEASPGEGGSRIDWLPERTVLDEVTWVSAGGSRTTISADARLGEDELPDNVTLRLTEGNYKGLQATVKRDVPKAQGDDAAAMARQWSVLVEVGGGKVEGRFSLKRTVAAVPAPPAGKPARPRASPAPGVQAPSYELTLQGDLKARDVEVSALTAPSRALTGKLEATSTLSARAATTSGLVDALQTRTSFTVRNAVIHGVDLVKAVQSAGTNSGGETPLDTLVGQVNSQGRNVQLNNLAATSGALSANGDVGISPAKALSGQLNVTVAGNSKVGGVVGSAVAVPLTVSGTLDNPEVGVSRSAMVGAAIGTAIMPGVGTGAGAKLGDRLGQSLRGLFGK